MIPGHMADELLDTLSLLVVEIGDGLTGLVIEFGEQSPHVLDGMLSLLRLSQNVCVVLL